MKKIVLISLLLIGFISLAYSQFYSVPTGVILPYIGSEAPSGYLICNGQAVSRYLYPDLFALIGTTFGNGDGSTTFNLPNLQGQFLRGVDTGAGVDPDRNTRRDVNGNVVGPLPGSFQSDDVIDHYHWKYTGSARYGYGIHNPIHSGATTDQIVRNNGSETRPKNFAVYYIIRCSNY